MTTDNSNDFPVFIVGSSRSGTTLLYSILLSSGAFPVYEAETRLLDECPAKYGSLKSDRNFHTFISDWTRSKQFYRSRLQLEKFKSQALYHRESYIDFLKFFMSTVAGSQGMKRWAEQTPGHIFHLKELAQAFPHARFIHIIRDGRAVALSRRKLGWTGTKTKDPLVQLLYAAFNWEYAVLSGQFYGKKLAKRYLEIRYEDLIVEQQKTLNRLGEFAQIDLDVTKITKCEIGSLGKPNSVFTSPMQGISNSALSRWKSVLSPIEVTVLNKAIGKSLRKLDYEVVDQHETTKTSLVKYLSLRKKIYLYQYKLKQFLKSKTPLGRMPASCLEIGLH